MEPEDVDALTSDELEKEILRLVAKQIAEEIDEGIVMCKPGFEALWNP